MSGYPNLYALTNGGVSGRLSEWPLLPIEARRALGEIETLRAENERLRAVVEKASRDLRLYDVADRLARAEQAARLVIQTAEAITDESAAARAKGGSDGD